MSDTTLVIVILVALTAAVVSVFMIIVRMIVSLMRAGARLAVRAAIFPINPRRR